MKTRHFYWLLTISVSLSLVASIHADADSDKQSGQLTKNDQQALAIGRAILRINELGKPGAPVMTDLQKIEFEKNVKFLSTTQSGRMTWAWLEFRIRSDSQLTLENNPGAKAIQQRLKIFKDLLRRYFVLE